ncbi:MAG: tRNA (guanosine(46)-N7)-methyltransferase TrmB [Candidatus Omnitrophica bacterium]|nr:tRNA (guanosine(46)-N7)-methyltransferase TrmB [Candidatus Omnitrophota bacterium]MDD5670118.1 tRNA (guanosine(46)-N7)-methyltransferase TrmB [Candidatus Omnitrophota bacterium]
MKTSLDLSVLTPGCQNQSTRGNCEQEQPSVPRARADYLYPKLKPDPDGIARLGTWFRDNRPVEIEIGCGKAKFLVARAAQHPEINFVAIDRVGKWMKKGERRAAKGGLNHILFLKADAREVLRTHVPPERVVAFHIYFPDPWPKRKHHKRRIVNADLLTVLYERLSAGGAVYLATDDPDYRNAMRKAVAESRLPWQVRESFNERLNEDFDFKTNYELKYEAQGKTLYYLELRKS